MAASVFFEVLESRRLLTSAQDITSLTALRQDPAFAGIDGSNIGIAVLDSGTWARHPDLRNNFAAFFDAVRSSSNSPGSTNVNDAFDPAGHGTHVAGTAASSNPNVGVATNARLIAIRALPADNEPEPGFDTVANGLQWVLNNVNRFNIKVVNLSLGVPTVNDNTGRISDQGATLIRRLERVGVTVVAAAGNNYADFAPRPGAATPAAYSTLVVSNVWSDNGVSGTFPQISGSGGNVRFFAQENDAAPDRFAATSQRSTLPGQIAAPGSQILSTWNDPNKLYQLDSGTSMSSPFVSGAVALMQEAAFVFGGRYLTPDQVRIVLLDSADTIIDGNVSSNSRIPVTFDSSGNPRRSGGNQDLPETGLSFKRIDVYAALRAVRSLVTGVPVSQPGEPVPVGVDPDATLATATAVPALDGNATFDFTANIGVDGQVQVGPGDVNAYRLTLLSPGVVSAQLTLGAGTAFSPLVRLFDSAGNQLASISGSTGAYPTLVSGRLPAGTYYLGVSAVGNAAYSVVDRSGVTAGGSTGDYTLTVGLANPDPNGVPQGAFLADLLSPDLQDPRLGVFATFVRGSIGSDPNPLNPSGPRVQVGATDVDMFRLVAPDSGLLTVTTRASSSPEHQTDGVDTFLRVFDENFNVVSVTNQFFGKDAAVQFAVARGQVLYVGISAFGNQSYSAGTPFDRASTTGQSGNYDAYFSFDNGDDNGTAFTATAATVGRTVNSVIGSTPSRPLLGAENGSKDVAFYRYVVPTTGLIDLTATGARGGLRPVMKLWRLSADRTTITRDADTTGRSARIIARADAGETLYVSVTGEGNDDFKWFAVASGSGGSTGAFSLASAMRPLSDLRRLTNSSVNFGTPTPVSAGVPVYANLGTTNAVETGPASVNLYRYTATFAGPLVIRATVPGDQATDPFLRLFDSAGTEITSNDDATASTRNAQISTTVVAGRTYFIGVNPSSQNARAYNPLTGDGAAGGQQGDYVLTLVAPPQLSLSASASTPINGAGGTVTFTLSLSAPATENVSADFATFDTTGPNAARSPSDYTPVQRTITLPAGQTSVTVDVPFVGDTTPGRTRVIGASLANIISATKGALTANAVIISALPPTPAATGPDLAVEAFELRPRLNATIVPGDRIPATVFIRNVGTTRLTGRFSLAPVISPDQYVSPSDVRLLAPRTISVSLIPGRAQRISTTLTVPLSIEQGNYFPLVSVLPLVATADAGPFNNTAAALSLDVQWLFGTFPGHTNSRLTLASADGTPMDFILSGRGFGRVTRDASNLLSVTLTDTTARSTLTIRPGRGTPRSATADLLDLQAPSPLRAILADNVSVLGTLNLPNPLPKTIKLRNR